MPQVDWMYHRKNCNSCAKATGFLEAHKIVVANQVDARTVPLVEADALRLIGESDDLYLTRGTKVLHVSLHQDRPADDVLLSMIIGRSGKLRAPALQVGRTLIVGYDLSTYQQILH